MIKSFQKEGKQIEIEIRRRVVKKSTTLTHTHTLHTSICLTCVITHKYTLAAALKRISHLLHKHPALDISSIRAPQVQHPVITTTK